MMGNGNSRILFVIDLLAIYAFFFIVFAYYRGDPFIPYEGGLLMGLIGFSWFFISISFNICNVNQRSKLVEVVKNVFVAYSVLSAIVIGVVAIYGDFRPNDKLILYPFLYALIFSTVLRFFYLIIIKHFIKNGYQQKTVLLIGGGHLAQKVMQKIVNNPELGFRLHGFLSDTCHSTMPKGFYLGKLDRFCDVVRTNQIHEVIIAKPLSKRHVVVDMIERCESEGVRFRIVPDFFPIVGNRAILENIAEIPLLAIRTEPLNLFRNRMIKRVFDILISLASLVVFSPLFLVVAIMVKISSPGPIFFKQKRVGINNLEFYIYKFRTMIVQENKDSDTIWTTASDDRVTAIGSFLRKTNMDELPQLWNVLIGEMSLIGPRPEREHFVEKFKTKVPAYKVRHLVKSGITGWAQVHGFRGDTSIAQRVEHDLYYIENWSFWLDLKILWFTLFSRKAWKHAY